MSFKAMKWAISCDPPSTTAKAVLVYLANYANHKGVAYPGQKRLARDAKLSERSVRDALKVLEGSGLISRVRRQRVDGSRTSDRCTLHMFSHKHMPKGQEDYGHAGPEGRTEDAVQCEPNGLSEPAISSYVRQTELDYDEIYAEYPPLESDPLQEDPPLEHEGGREDQQNAHRQVSLFGPEDLRHLLPESPADSAGLYKPNGLYEPIRRTYQTRARDLRPVFDEFYAQYPRKVGRPSAERAYVKAAKLFPGDVILRGLLRAAAEWNRRGTPKDKIPYPATWLNDHRFNDEPEDQANAPSKNRHSATPRENKPSRADKARRFLARQAEIIRREERGKRPSTFTGL